jgi:hypothetical protein
MFFCYQPKLIEQFRLPFAICAATVIENTLIATGSPASQTVCSRYQKHAPDSGWHIDKLEQPDDISPDRHMRVIPLKL